MAKTKTTKIKAIAGPVTGLNKKDGRQSTRKTDNVPTTAKVPETHYNVIGDRDIELCDICVSPLNPRKHFDPKELAELAESFIKHGQLQNLTVRQIVGDAAREALDTSADYELIGGERRYRAASSVGMRMLRCRIIQCDDATAVELRGIENYRRSQLNAIEEAIWFTQMIDTGRFNQTTLAAYLGITPGQVSNRLRLLSLPEKWQRRVIEGKLPATHARSLAAWSHRPNVLAAVEENLFGEGDDGKKNRENNKDQSILDNLSVASLDATIQCEALDLSRSMDQNRFNGRKFELTDELRKELDIESIPGGYTGAPPEERAFNVDLFDRLNAEAKEAQKSAAKEASSGESHGSSADGESGSSGDSRPLNVSRLTDYGLEKYFSPIFAREIANRLKPDLISVRLLFTLLSNWDNAEALIHYLAKDNDDGPIPEDDSSTYAVLRKIQVSGLPKLAHAVLVDQMSDSEGFDQFNFDFLVELTRTDIPCDPLKDWRADREILELCSTNELRELFTDEMADEKKLSKWDRERLINELFAHWPAGYLPMLLKPEALYTDSERAIANVNPADDDEDQDDDSDEPEEDQDD